MRAFTLSQIIEGTGAQVISEPHKIFVGVGTDTRQDLSGQIFIALKGESFDAHDFLLKAVEQKAAGVLLHAHEEVLLPFKNKLTLLKVPDTLKALQGLGTWARRQSQARVLGITGSNGKTTTKEFAAAVIGSVKSVHYNRGSFNNHWGVPFTLLQLEPQKEVALVEMGMNHAGELTELVHIAEPDAVVCTMVGQAHIEFFGTLEKIAEAKEEIYLAAKPTALRIFNLDSEQTRGMAVRAREKKLPGEILTFSSQNPEADVHFKILSLGMDALEIEGHVLDVKKRLRIPLFGAQNLTNLMAAAALGLAAGLTAEQVWKGLENCRTTWGRNQLVHLLSGAEIIFDAYNANPDSMKALLENSRLLKNAGKKIGVFGEMLEMGDAAAELHRELGAGVGKVGFDKVYFVGSHARDFFEGLKQAQFTKACHVEKEFKEEMAVSLSQELQRGDIAVIKGSRGMKLEKFVLACAPLDFDLKKD